MRRGLARVKAVGLVLCVMASFAGKAWASTIVWGNNATFGNVTLEAFNMDTGALVDQFIVQNLEAVGDNGRGIAVVGTTIYYSVASSGNVFVTDSVTHADLGVAFNTGLGGIANLAWDGTNLWVTAYDGSANAHLYLPDGTFVKDVIGFGGNRDGFEVTETNLIANRGDAQGPYDLYDLDGNLVQAAFISPNFSPTGITFDGTFYYVSNIFGNEIHKYDSSGNFVSFVTLGGPLPQTCCGRLLEDLSSLGNIAENPPSPPPGNGGVVPEPSSLMLMGSGLLGFFVRRKKRARAI